MHSNWLVLGTALCAMAASSGCIGTPERVVAAGCIAVALALSRRPLLVVAAVVLGVGAALRVEWTPLVAVANPSAEPVLAVVLTTEAPEGQASGWVLCPGDQPRRAVISGLEGPLHAGARLQVRARLRDLSRAPTPDRRDPRRGARARRASVGVSVRAALNVVDQGKRSTLDAVRQSWSAHLRRHVGRSAGLWQALILGDRAGLEDAAFARVQRLGMAHLLALSGMHTSILAGALIWPLRRRGRRMILWALPGLLVWMVLAGSSASLVRATGMVTWWVVARRTGRSSSVVDAIAAIALIEIVLRPHLLYGVGWWLSYAATLAVVRCASAVGRWPRPVAAIAISLSAQAATLPWVLDAFGAMNLLSALTLLLVAPVFAAVLVAGLGAWFIGALLPWAAPWCDALVIVLSHCFGATLLLVRLAGATQLWHPGFSSFAWAVAMGCVALLIWPGSWRRGWRLGAVALLVVGIHLLPRADHEWVIFDVGQGDASVLRCGEDFLVIDTGPKWDQGAPAGWTVADFLLRRRARRIRIAISHGHLDHSGGMAELLGRLPASAVRDVIVAECDRSRSWVRSLQETGVPITFVQSGDRFELGHCVVDVLWPPPDVQDMSTNNRSLVFRVAVGAQGQSSLLMMGDLEREAEARLLELRPEPGPVYALKVAHHGGNTGTTDPFLEWARPRHALISTGAGNRYGHPTPEALARLQASGAAIYRTDLCGYFRLTWGVDRDPGAPRCVHAP